MHEPKAGGYGAAYEYSMGGPALCAVLAVDRDAGEPTVAAAQQNGGKKNAARPRGWAQPRPRPWLAATAAAQYCGAKADEVRQWENKRRRRRR